MMQEFHQISSLFKLLLQYCYSTFEFSDLKTLNWEK
jgi:hypothetical protein